MITALVKCFASDSSIMDKIERNGRRGRQSKRDRGRTLGASKFGGARNIPSARTPSSSSQRRQVVCTTSDHKSIINNKNTPDNDVRESEGERSFDAECNESRELSSPPVVEVATPRVEDGKRRGMSARMETLKSRGYPSLQSPVPVPSVVYLSPRRLHPKPRTTPSSAAKPAEMKAVPRLDDLEAEVGFDIDASTISASPSTHSIQVPVSNDVDLVGFDRPKRKESARFGEVENRDAAAPSPPQRLPSRKLNPNAPVYVPGGEGNHRRSSRYTTITRTFCRPTPKTSDALVGRDVQQRLTRTPKPQTTTPSGSLGSSFPSVHPLSYLSRQAGPAPKITVVSEKFKIFVIDLMSEEDCDWVLQCAEQHVAQCAISGRSTWRKIYTHTLLDLPCCEVVRLRSLTNLLLVQMRQIVGKTWKARRAASYLVPRSWKEPHLLRFQKVPNQSEHDHTGMIMHHDGGDISWHLMLSAQGIDYTGGGTYFRCLRKTIVLRKGQVLVHPGNLYHRGVDITSGTRTLMVCFMDGYDPKVKDPSNAEEDLAEFQRNIVEV